MNILTMPLGGVNAVPSQTPAMIQAAQRIWHLAANCSFPLERLPARSYKDSGSGFGTKREAIGPGILHPACDLEVPAGTPVLAIDDGIVLAGPYDFYLGTDAIDIKHGFFIARYGELKKGGRLKDRFVKRGDMIGHVGNVGSGHMLHLEMFAGTESGPLTQKWNPPWNRRKDMLDPTPFLDLWALKL